MPQDRTPITRTDGRYRPAEACLLCDRQLRETGGRRLTAQQERGVHLSSDLRGSPDRGLPHHAIRLSEDSPLQVVTWGERETFTTDVLLKARSEFLAGRHPWFCQPCGKRSCPHCGAPLRLPMGSDVLDDDGGITHVPIVPVAPDCSNPACDKFESDGD